MPDFSTTVDRPSALFFPLILFHHSILHSLLFLFLCVLLLIVTHTLPQTISLHFSYLLLVMTLFSNWVDRRKRTVFIPVFFASFSLYQD